MAGASIDASDVRKFYRDAAKVSKELARELQKEARRIAEPTAADARSRAQRFGARTVSGIAAGSSVGIPLVKQRRRRTTGRHPGFAGLLFGRAFAPAAASHQEQVAGDVEDVISDVTKRNGFGGLE